MLPRSPFIQALAEGQRLVEPAPDTYSLRSLRERMESAIVVDGNLTISLPGGAESYTITNVTGSPKFCSSTRFTIGPDGPWDITELFPDKDWIEGDFTISFKADVIRWRRRAGIGIKRWLPCSEPF